MNVECHRGYSCTAGTQVQPKFNPTYIRSCQWQHISSSPFVLTGNEGLIVVPGQVIDLGVSEAHDFLRCEALRREKIQFGRELSHWNRIHEIRKCFVCRTFSKRVPSKSLLEQTKAALRGVAAVISSLNLNVLKHSHSLCLHCCQLCENFSLACLA
jgi:hypothetical protein